jgi:hypothetical protein
MAGGSCSQVGDISGVMSGQLEDLLFTPTFIENNRQELTEFLAETTPLHSKGESLQRQLQAFGTHDTCDTLTDIQATTLIIAGDKDVAIPRSNSDLLAAKIPNAKLEIIDDAAHGFSYSHPDLTANLIQLFLQEQTNMEKPIVENADPAILQTFGAYIQAFNSLEPTKVLPFFHLPAMLMTTKEVAVMEKPIEVLGIFAMLMDDLKHKNFKESQIVGALEVKQLSDNQGQVIAVAKRFNDKDEEIEHFGFTYTLRKVEDTWKIVTGVLYEPEPLSNSK